MTDPMTDNPASEIAEIREWRCFHCDELFTDRAEALAHFGDNEGEEAGCKLTALEGGLLKLYREAQGELRGYRQEDAEAHRTFYALGADHYQAVRRSEEEGYAKGLKDNSDRAELKQQIASLTAQLAKSREAAVEECAKAVCLLCHDGVELVPHSDRYYGGWHQITELGGASDGGTDYEECAAFAIRALSTGERQ